MQQDRAFRRQGPGRLPGGAEKGTMPRIGERPMKLKTGGDQAMGVYIMIGRDGSAGTDLRPGIRPAHLEHWGAVAAQGGVLFAGPLLENGRPAGSVIVFQADGLEAARAVAARDPYFLGGVFATLECYESKQVLPQP